MGALRYLMLIALTLSACRAPARGQVDARATDEWRRTYTLEQGQEFSIANRNGAVEIQGVDGSTLDVRAERVVHARLEKTATDLLPKVEIAEDVTPGRVSIRTKGVEGILVGVTWEITYRVRVPFGTTVRVQATNGDVKAESLGGGVEIRSVNGKVTADLKAIGVDPISLRTTNGGVTLTIPAAANANLQASAANGTVELAGLTFQPTGEPGPGRGRARRVRGRLNAGGTSIDVQTVNGSVSISARTP